MQSASSGLRLYGISVSPFSAAGRDPGPDEGRCHVSRIGVGGSYWACWPDNFWLGMWSLSLQPPPLPLSPSRRNCTCARVGPPATGSGLTRPVGHAGAGHRPSYPSGIRMETAPQPPAAGLVSLQRPARRRGRSARPGPVRASPRGGWVGSKFMPRDTARNYVPRNLISCESVYIIGGPSELIRTSTVQ